MSRKWQLNKSRLKQSSRVSSNLGQQMNLSNNLKKLEKRSKSIPHSLSTVKVPQANLLPKRTTMKRAAKIINCLQIKKRARPVQESRTIRKSQKTDKIENNMSRAKSPILP